MSGKFNSLRDEVIYRATLDTSYLSDEIGTTDELGWFGLMEDYYGSDYIVAVDNYGFVTVETFPENIMIDDSGYYDPAVRRWAEIREMYSAYYDETGEYD